MRRLFLLVCLFLIGGFCFVLYSTSVEATLKYRKETGKRCTFCHTGVPKAGDEDPKLNQDGKIFRDNGYKLTEEQKAKPDGD
jgi:hypothetical protein